MLLRLLLLPVTIYIGYLIIRFFLWLRKLNKALANVPTMPNPHWLIGNVGQIRARGSFVDARSEALTKLGVGTMKVYLGPIPVLITRDLDFFKYIHNNQTGSPTPFVRVYAPMVNRTVRSVLQRPIYEMIWVFSLATALSLRLMAIPGAFIERTSSRCFAIRI